MGEDLKVTISLERFEQLVDVETRVKIITDETIKSRYNVDRETMATILGIELPKEEDQEGVF